MASKKHVDKPRKSIAQQLWGCLLWIGGGFAVCVIVIMAASQTGLLTSSKDMTATSAALLPTELALPTLVAHDTTPTSEDIATLEARINLTEHPKNTALPTSTITFTPSTTITDTPSPGPTTAGTLAVIDTFYAARSANLRRCAQLTSECGIVDTVEGGTTLDVLALVNGGSFSGSEVWYLIRYEGQELYIHSSLVVQNLPAQPAQSQILPQVPLPQSTIPLVPFVPVAPVSSASCPSLSAMCSQLTCAQAYACLAAGNEALDHDNDGVPCDSACPGG